MILLIYFRTSRSGSSRKSGNKAEHATASMAGKESSMDFSGKTAIITGGTSGIGLALGELLASSGAHVVLVARNKERGEKGAKALQGGKGSVRFEGADVSDADAIKRVVASAIAERGRLDYLFNNAGVGVIGEARDLSIEQWRAVIDTDLMGVVNGIAAAYPRMIEQGFGHIVNVSSVGGFFPTPGAVPYIAAKYGVFGLSRSLRIEAALVGVRVSVACPPGVETEFFNVSINVGYDLAEVAKVLPGGLMSAKKCAEEILNGVAKNKAIILPGSAPLLYFLARRFPALTDAMGKGILAKLTLLRKDPKAAS
jgi:NAD(P)-dependent dehydrogenase (short-subunit alcohol dehydrogenase family)